MTLVASGAKLDINDDSPFYHEDVPHELADRKIAPSTLRCGPTPLPTESPPVESPQSATWPPQATVPRSPPTSLYQPFVTVPTDFYPTTQAYDWEASGPALQASHTQSSHLPSRSAPSPRPLTESTFGPLSHSPSSSHFSSSKAIAPSYTLTNGTTSSKNNIITPHKNHGPLVASQSTSYEPFSFPVGTPAPQHPSSLHQQQTHQQTRPSHRPQDHPSQLHAHSHSHLQQSYMHKPNLNYSLPALHHQPQQRHSDHYSHHAAQSLPEDWHAHANRIGANVDMEAESISEGEHVRLASHHQWAGVYPGVNNRGEHSGANGVSNWDGRMEGGINGAGHWNGSVWYLPGDNGLYPAEASDSGEMYNRALGHDFKPASDTSSGSVGGAGGTMDGEKAGRKTRRKNGEPPRDLLQRRYACELCVDEPKSFARPSALRIHMLTHTKEKPHACPICDRPFAIFSNLKRHQKLHRDASNTPLPPSERWKPKVRSATK